MLRVLYVVVATGFLAACGRIHFEPQSDDAAIVPDTGAPSVGELSDYFSGCTIDADVWEEVDPSRVGTFASDGDALRIDVAGTTEGHDIWSCPGEPDSFSYTVPRLLRRVQDIDFEVEAKFDSAISMRFQQQGIVVEQDEENVIRVEFHSEGTNTRIFVAYVVDRATTTVLNEPVGVAGMAPLYLRVRRTGSHFDVLHSFDGNDFQQLPNASFEQEYTVTKLGVFAGNGPMVDQTAVIDHFRDVNVPFDPVAAQLQVCP